MALEQRDEILYEEIMAEGGGGPKSSEYKWRHLQTVPPMKKFKTRRAPLACVAMQDCLEKSF